MFTLIREQLLMKDKTLWMCLGFRFITFVTINSCFYSKIYRRGKVFKPIHETSSISPGLNFKCDSAILLLQHGVDPNMYNISDVWFQFSRHTRYSCFGGCVKFSVILETFLAAGYHFTSVDHSNRVIREKLRRFGVNVAEPNSLKQMCRSAIRERLRKSTKDTTIFPAIDTLHIPTLMRDYLKLRDIIDIDSLDGHCRGGPVHK